MPSGCDEACMKAIIDAGMPMVAGRFYGGCLSRIEGLRPQDYEAPYFYVGVVDLCFKIAQALNQGRENDDQKERIAHRLDHLCYVANEIRDWGREDDAAIVAHAAERTQELFEYATEEQEFWTEISQESKHPKGKKE